MEGFDILGADEVHARRTKYMLTGSAIGLAASLIGLFGWSAWRHYLGRVSSGHRIGPWSFRRVSWSGNPSVLSRDVADGQITTIVTTAAGAIAGMGAGRLAAHRKEQAALPPAPQTKSLPGAK